MIRIKQTQKEKRTDSMAKQTGLRNRIRFGIWNVRTLREPSRLAQLENEMNNYKLDLIGLSEVRWTNHGEFITQNGNKLIYSGQNTHEKGVGILMSSNIAHSLLEWKPINERILTARFAAKNRNVTIIQCYAPTEDADEEIKDIFYDQITGAIASTHRRDIIILAGDMNAKIGQDNTGHENIMGKNGLGIMNNNGERLAELCHANELIIGGTIYPHKAIHKYTWTSPDSRTKNQIDHICISKKWRESIQDVRAYRGADMHTDHNLVISKICIKPIRPRNNQHQSNRMKFNPATPEKCIQFTEAINQVTENLNSWNDICSAYQQTAKQILGPVTNNKKPWISTTTWDLIQQRKVLLARTLQDGNALNRQNYAEVAKKVKKAARKDKRRYYANIARDTEKAATKHDMRKVYNNIRKLTKNFGNTEKLIKDKEGNLLTTNEEQLTRWHEHFSEVNNSANISTTGPREHVIRNEDSVPEPSINEVIEAIRNLKNNKAAGEDGLQAELLKISPAQSAEIITPLLREAWSSNNIPKEWKKGIIIKLPKKGNLQECSNWRGITLLNTINKLLASIIMNRISDKIEHNLRDNQAGFRPNRGCTDQTNTLRIITEQSMEWQTPLFVGFVDFRRAFDTINREAIWTALRKRNIQEKYIDIIKALYESAENVVLHNGKYSEPLIIKSGVKQGCLMSPALFNIVLDDVLTSATRNSEGIIWGESSLKDLDYADDIALIASSHSDMQRSIDNLHTTALTVGLEINITKTKIMRINDTNHTPITLGNTAIEDVEDFTYLGTTITTNGGTDKDIQNRLNKARQAFGRLFKIWKSSQITRNTKLRIFNASVKSVLLYGCETWKTTRLNIQSLQTFVNKCLRIICKIFWPNRISNIDLWNITNQTPIHQVIKERRWKWIGHTLRKNQEAISRQALQYNPPNGRRKRGRPRQTWKRTVDAELCNAGLTWEEVTARAQNRQDWRTCVRSLCSLEE